MVVKWWGEIVIVVVLRFYFNPEGTESQVHNLPAVSVRNMVGGCRG